VVLHQRKDFIGESPADRTRTTGPGNEFAFTFLLVHPMFFGMRLVPDRFTTSRYTIANWVWEQTELPTEITNSLPRVDEIWASSEFVRSTYARATDKPVTLIPHPIGPNPISPLRPPSCDRSSMIQPMPPLSAHVQPWTFPCTTQPEWWAQ